MRRSKSASGWLVVCVLMVLISAATASPARAQASGGSESRCAGGFDFADAYFFRGHLSGRHWCRHSVLGCSLSKVSMTVPVKVGLSYYDGISGDETFGFLSVAGAVAVPFTSAPTRFGSWNIHGGVEFLMLGDRNEAVFGDSSHVIGSIGIGLSY
jgi:hypothetical protein